MNIIELKNAVHKSRSKREVLRILEMPCGGSQFKWLNKMLIDNNIDYSHFKKLKPVKYISKTCPVCGEYFVAAIRSGKKEKVTCSSACANTYFRTGENHPNYINGKNSYSEICFRYHDRKCIICGEDKIVDVHHFDKNRNNNTPENLIPLCPTHHRYLHSQYRCLIIQQVEKYIQNFRFEP